MKQFKYAVLAICIYTVSVLTYSNTNAQITAASNPDNTLMPGVNFTDIETLNCDMVTVGSGNKMTAVVIEGSTPSSGYYAIHVECNGQVFDILTTYNAFSPDIVIADNTDPNAILGEDYLVTIVYEHHNSPNDIIMEVFEFNQMGTGSDLYTGKNVYTLYTPNGFVQNPHIDLWGDRNNTSVNNMQQLHDYIVTWDYDPNISGYNVEYVYGTVLPSGNTTVSSVYTAVTNAHLSDVSAQTVLNPSSVERTAWISYIDQGSNSLKILQQDFDNTLTPLGSTITTLDNTHSFADILPRIEAQALADVTSGSATWNIVAAENTPTSTIPTVYVFNDAGGTPSATFDVTSAGSGNNGIDYFVRSPCVAGVGPNMASSASGIATTQFSIGYFSTYTHAPSVGGSTGGDYYSNSIDISGGGWSSTYNQYYEVNSNDMFGAAPGAMFSPQNKTTMAITSSSNEGDDLFTVWYTGVDASGSGNGILNYKFSSNNYSYKPTTVNETKAQIRCKIYPNPAVDHITIEGAANADYAISNMTGILIQKGVIKGTHEIISTKTLPTGVYLMSLIKDNEIQRHRFIKK